jgi:hypothetical protein
MTAPPPVIPEKCPNCGAPSAQIGFNYKISKTTERAANTVFGTGMGAGILIGASLLFGAATGGVGLVLAGLVGPMVAGGVLHKKIMEGGKHSPYYFCNFCNHTWPA